MNQLIFTGYYQKAHRNFYPDVTFDSDEFIGDMSVILSEGLTRAMDDENIEAVVVCLVSSEHGPKAHAVKVVRIVNGFEVGFYPGSLTSEVMPEVRSYKHLTTLLTDVRDWLMK